MQRTVTHADGTMLTLDDGRAVQVAARPDPSGTAVVHAAMRRVMHVDLAVDGDWITTTVRGIGHRRTCTLPVSLETALALAMQGCPCSLEISDEVMPA